MRRKKERVDLQELQLYGEYHLVEDGIPEPSVTSEIGGSEATLSVPVMGFWFNEEETMLNRMTLVRVFIRKVGVAISVSWLNDETKKASKRVLENPPSHWMYISKRNGFSAIKAGNYFIPPSLEDLNKEDDDFQSLL